MLDMEKKSSKKHKIYRERRSIEMEGEIIL